MNWKRILRDSSIVGVLCAVFFFSANVINSLGKPDDRAFSADRLLADRLFASRKWELASVQFAKLTEQDRFNGNAWFYQAVCHTWMISEIEQDIAARQQAGATEAELKELESSKRLNEDKAINCFKQASEFLRHRRRALVNIAAVYVSRQEWDQALAYLQDYIDEGNLNARSLEGVSNLGSGGRAMLNLSPESAPEAGLHRFPEFWKLVDREREIRGY